MLLEKTGTETKISGNSGAPTSFKVRTSATLFSTMSDNLYNDKVRAVIRELSCNAWDAHAAAGKKNQPFEVHLPTQFEPWFSITDFGTGLRFIKGGCEDCGGKGVVAGNQCYECDGTGDYDGVKRLYCTYFASDKQDSNDAIGGFGLGSKSPFAYLNSRKNGKAITGGFTVTNHYKGVTYNYDAHVSEAGYPDVVAMGEPLSTPDVPNGVEVTFPVAPGDIWEFENKAKAVFEFFTPRPILNKDITIPTPTYSVHSDLWGMRTNADTAQGSELRAIMGNVQYTVGSIDISRLSEAQQRLVGMPIDLFFKVGELQPAASREALSLVGDTISNILARLDVVQDKLMEEVKAKIDACPTGWEARLKIMELMLQDGLGPLVKDAYNKGMLDGKYKTFRLAGARVKVNELDYNNITAVQFVHNDRAKRKAKKENLFDTNDNAKRVNALRDVAAGVSKKSDYDIKFEVNERVVFVINDLTRGSADKYVNYMLQNDTIRSTTYVKAIVLQRVHKTVSMNRAGAEAVAFLDTIGNPPFIMASALKAEYDPKFKEEKVQQVVKRERMSIRLLHRHEQYTRRHRWNSSGNNNGWKKQWLKGDDHYLLNDFSATKFYVEVENSGVAYTLVSSLYEGRSFVEFVNKVRESSLFPEITSSTPIFGVKKGSKLLDDPNFVQFTTFVKNRLEAELTPAKQMAMSLTIHPFNSEWKGVLEYVIGHPMVLSHDSPVRQFALAWDRARQQDQAGFSSVKSLAHYYGISIDNTADFNKAWEKVYKQYPMLKICGRKGYGSCTLQEENNIMTDYIRSVDEKRKLLILSNVVMIDEEREAVNA